MTESVSQTQVPTDTIFVDMSPGAASSQQQSPEKVRLAWLSCCFDSLSNYHPLSAVKRVSMALWQSVQRICSTAYRALFGKKIHGGTLVEEPPMDPDVLLSTFIEVANDKGLPATKVRDCLQACSSPFAGLMYLSVNHKNLRSLPPEIQFLHLEDLDLSSNKFQKIPRELLALRACLKSLEFSDNAIDEVFPEIGSFELLDTLDLSRNRISHLPREIGNLQHIEILHLEGNFIADLPDVFANMKDLSHIYLEGNKLKSLPPSLCSCQYMHILQCSGNELEILPEEMGRLEDLEMLNLSDNKIVAVPSALGNCGSLTYLNLGHNCLGDLPEDLANLTQVTTMNISGNQFKILPSFFAKLNSLVTLDISNNPIKQFPEVLLQIRSLKKVIVDANQFFQWISSQKDFAEKHPTLTLTFWTPGPNSRQLKVSEHPSGLSSEIRQRSQSSGPPMSSSPSPPTPHHIVPGDLVSLSSQALPQEKGKRKLPYVKK